jgi:hypothetical protein
MSNNGNGPKLPPNDLPLMGWFFAYVVGTVVLFLAIPWSARLLGDIPPGPWHYWWVFLFVTPLLAAIVLLRQAEAGRFSWLGVAVFLLAALALGVFYWWFSYELSGVV